jgi:diaminopimelate epimerase
LDVAKEGAALRWHAAFAPQGVNANFVEVEAPGRLAIRTYERGVEAETLACGTGVCAAAIVHAHHSGNNGPVEVRVRGGETLTVSFTRDNGNFRDLVLHGPADFVFDGEISL